MLYGYGLHGAGGMLMGKVILGLALAGWLGVALVGCNGSLRSNGKPAAGGSAGTAGAGATSGSAGADAGGPGGAGPSGDGGPDAAYNIPDAGHEGRDAVATDAWCAPDAAFGVLQPTACCNDQPCQGLCYPLDGGALRCECYGVIGGCKNGTVCCKLTHSCMPNCDAP